MVSFNDPMEFASGVTLKNRLVMSPVTTVQSFYDGTITTNEIKHYSDRAKGVGAIITGSANVQDGGKGWQGELSIASDDKLPELKQLASAIQNNGAKAIVQIFHGGRMSNPIALMGRQAVSASAVAALHRDPNKKSPVPREMTVDDIHKTVKAFGQATRRAIEAGFDGVEIHGANNYLFQQFFSPQSNLRTDQYGGSVEKRYTFIKEVIEEVFATVDEYARRPFAVGYRFSPEEHTNPGITLDDTFYLLSQLVETRLDYLHLSLVDHNYVSHTAQYQDKPLIQYIHEAINGQKPLVGVGGVRTRADVSEVLQNAEVVAVARQLIVDPNWAEKLINGQDEDMISADFEQAIEYANLSQPFYHFVANWIKSKKKV
ncbi:NADH-dependent flavin oxidoreductase [Paucilactobacillus sp. N302-9]